MTLFHQLISYQTSSNIYKKTLGWPTTTARLLTQYLPADMTGQFKDDCQYYFIPKGN